MQLKFCADSKLENEVGQIAFTNEISFTAYSVNNCHWKLNKYHPKQELLRNALLE